LNISDLFGFIIDDTYLISDLLKISVEEDIFLLVYIYFFSTDLSIQFYFIYNHSSHGFFRIFIELWTLF